MLVFRNDLSEISEYTDKIMAREYFILCLVIFITRGFANSEDSSKVFIFIIDTKCKQLGLYLKIVFRWRIS